MKGKVKVALISGACTIIAAAITGYCSYQAGRLNMEQGAHGMDGEDNRNSIDTLTRQMESLAAENENLKKEIEELKSSPGETGLGNTDNGDISETQDTKKINESSLLYSMDPVNYNSSRFHREGAASDRLGNVFNNAILLGNLALSNDNSKDIEKSLEYYLNGQYNRLAGTLAYSNEGSGDTIYLNIYADGQLIYTSASISAKTEPVDFALDLNSPEFLEFIVFNEGNDTYNYVLGEKMILANMVLYSG